MFYIDMMWKGGRGVKSIKIAEHERKEHYKVFAVTFSTQLCRQVRSILFCFHLIFQKILQYMYLIWPIFFSPSVPQENRLDMKRTSSFAAHYNRTCGLCVRMWYLGRTMFKSQLECVLIRHYAKKTFLTLAPGWRWVASFAPWLFYLVPIG